MITEQIGDNMELTIYDGLPESKMTPSQISRTALSLVQNGIPLGVDISAGILGGIRYATLRIGSEYYKLKYSIRVMRVLTAAEVYNEAILWIEYKKQRGMLDRQLADDALSYLRGDFNNQIRR